MSAVLQMFPLGFPWTTLDPFLFCVHHVDNYPAGNEELGPAASLTGRDLGMDFEAALEKLPDGAREIFVLHDVEGYKHHEIATMLEISAGTSKAQLHRARMMLRRHLK